MNQGFTDIHRDKVEACKQGDRSAQKALYDLYAKAMFNVAFRIGKQREFAEDVIQEAFVKAFTNLKSYRGESTFGAWLKRIVINQALGKLKAEKLSFEPIEEDFKETVIADSEEDKRQDFNIDQVKAAILQLPDGYRTVLSLYLLEGLDHEEISQLLGISKSTSKTQYKRAKDKLRTMLNNERRAYG